MDLFFWDTSAITKRYVVEEGSQTVNSLLAMEATMCITFPIYAETIATLLRRRNQGDILPSDFANALDVLEQETLQAQRFEVLETDADIIIASIPVILRHNLNSSDAAILATYLQYATSEP